MSEKMLEFIGEVKQVGQDAYLINVDGMTGWVPNSEADYVDEPERGKEITFFIPEWLAVKKGFI